MVYVGTHVVLLGDMYTNGCVQLTIGQYLEEFVTCEEQVSFSYFLGFVKTVILVREHGFVCFHPSDGAGEGYVTFNFFREDWIVAGMPAAGRALGHKLARLVFMFACSAFLES